MQKILLLLTVVLLPFLTLAQKGVLFVDQEIKADGQLDENVWQNIPIYSGFYNFFPINEGRAENDTEVRIFHDGKYLNVAFVYHDARSDIRVNSLKRDDYGQGFHLSDCIGLIIDPYNNQNKGYFFGVNGLGTQLDALIANYDEDNLSWDAIWESGVAQNGKDKIYELKIPLSAISYDENINNWSFQFYTRDAKKQLYTVWNKFERGFFQFDTRFLRPMEMSNLTSSKEARILLIPAISAGWQKNREEEKGNTFFQPSLDVQYKISDGLRLDATINPDFSQIDVDQQVTNLTRFNIVFPERRNFFVENSDMFTTLGAGNDINPFYSRFIGASEDILGGIKLSGNIAPKTRIGLLNVQSKSEGSAQNYTVAVGKQQLSNVFNATTYFINRQNLDDFSLDEDYNRVAGMKFNYLSKNRKWAGFTTYSHSFNELSTSKNNVFAIENQYRTKKLAAGTRINKVGQNYITDIGFTPRIYNYDAISKTTVREGYTLFYQDISANYFPENAEKIQVFRYLNASVGAYLDENGEVFETNYFYNTALFFANQMSVYINGYYDDVKLKYAFDLFRNEQYITPGQYQNKAVRVGYNSDYTQSLYGDINAQWGTFYGGERTRLGTTLGYRFLPLVNIEINYEYNLLTVKEIGQENLHLLGITTEVFLSNKLNWTTYIQYNQQIDNVNINTRLQWEYRPLSFVYLVYADNYTQQLHQKNRGVSLKINRRFNF